MKIGKYNIHLHSMSVHFTNGLYPVAVLSLILFIISKHEPFIEIYIYLIMLATLSAPISFLTGIIEWKQKYKGARIKLFTRKYTYGMVLIGVGGLCMAVSFICPDIIRGLGILRIIFILLNLAILPIVFYLGYLGGRLVLGGSH